MAVADPSIHIRIPPEYHAALKRICDADGVTQKDFAERAVIERIQQIVHRAMVIAGADPLLGFGGITRDSSGPRSKP